MAQFKTEVAETFETNKKLAAEVDGLKHTVVELEGKLAAELRTKMALAAEVSRCRQKPARGRDDSGEDAGPGRKGKGQGESYVEEMMQQRLTQQLEETRQKLVAMQTQCVPPTTLSLTLTHTHSLTHSLTLTITITLSLSLSLTHTHNHRRARAYHAHPVNAARCFGVGGWGSGLNSTKGSGCRAGGARWGGETECAGGVAGCTRVLPWRYADTVPKEWHDTLELENSEVNPALLWGKPLPARRHCAKIVWALCTPRGRARALGGCGTKLTAPNNLDRRKC